MKDFLKILIGKDIRIRTVRDVLSCRLISVHDDGCVVLPKEKVDEEFVSFSHIVTVGEHEYRRFDPSRCIKAHLKDFGYV